ncbi:hypothetical protein D9619_005050 [Psilocybe cf. subviscida]|uniref:F-box domain-containing protein n=1 Tax=Psilocybe cf. subviscida TaxID=2480587 RepID=A0A8H5BNZ2_9AGAR|nr:hypothetical protein D9619_005050 [Psilocybe cf. subviscida]
MASVNDLPMEMLGHIFYLAAAGYLRALLWYNPERKYLCLFDREFARYQPPFLFLQVCGHWRAVAQATPILWTSLDVTMRRTTVTQASTSRSTAALKHWLSVSRSAPLNFTLESTGRRTDPNTRREALAAHSAAMLRVLANESYRWHSVSLKLASHLAGVFCDVVFNKFTQRSFPNLKRLDIVVLNETPGPVEEVSRAIGSFKSLTELCISLSLHVHMSFLLRHMPWDQLTSARFNMDMSTDQATSLLAHLTEAVTVTFANIHVVGDSDREGNRCTLPKLKQLSVNGDNASRLFYRFNFLHLEQLEFKSNPLGCDQLVQWLTEQPNVPICRLKLRSFRRFSESNLTNWLRIQRLREVAHVELHCWNILEATAGAVAQLQDGIPVLWSWKAQGEECIGWKPQFDHNDGHVARIRPARRR